MLEELGDAEEEGGGLLGAEGLADIEKVDNFGEEDAALAGADGSLVEDARFLDDSLWKATISMHESEQSGKVVVERLRSKQEGRVGRWGRDAPSCPERTSPCQSRRPS